MIVVAPEDKKTASVNVPLTSSMSEEIQRLARERGVPRAVLVRQVIREWLASQREEPTPGA
jgi:hypothetical protein